MFNSIVLLIAIIPTLMCSFVNSMRFDLKSGEPKCITEEIKGNALTVGNYSVVNPIEGYPLPDSYKISVRSLLEFRTIFKYLSTPLNLSSNGSYFILALYNVAGCQVSSPYGKNYHFGDHVASGNFAFNTVEAGDHTACFSMLDHIPSITVTIDFEWRTGVAAKDWYKIAKKYDIDVMESELHRLYDTVTFIHDEMFYLRGREEEMQDLNRATDNKMFTFIFLSIIVCLSVSGLQIWHLKTFFESKKLL